MVEPVSPPMSILVVGAILLGLLSVFGLWLQGVDLGVRDPDPVIQPVVP